MSVNLSLDPAQLPVADPRHFARAVTELGERRPVQAHVAIYNTQGVKILDKGVRIDARLYERLTRHQLRVPLEQCVTSEPSVTPATVAASARQIGVTEPLLGAMLADEAFGEALGTELGLVPLPQPVAFQLTLMHETRAEAWLHALRCAVAAGWLALRTGMTRHDARMLAVGGLVHDIGMLHLDPALSARGDALTRDQRRQLYAHPLLGAMLLERHQVYPPALIRAVLEHHEALNGAGYPRNLQGDALSAWGRVLALTEVVTALAEPGREAPLLRLSLALRMNRHRFDADLVREVQALIGRLPPPEPAGPVRPDALAALAAVDRLLHAWPAEAPAGAPTPMKVALGQVHELTAEVLRMLAQAGVAAEQLAQLGPDATADASLAAELTLLAREATWQLRSVARQARRRWRLVPGGAAGELPAWMRGWLDEADRLVAGWMVEQA